MGRRIADEGGPGCEVRLVIDAEHWMDHLGIIYTAAPNAYAALPNARHSKDACRMDLRNNPPAKPVPLHSYMLRLDGPRQREYAIYIIPVVFADEQTHRTQIQRGLGMSVMCLRCIS